MLYMAKFIDFLTDSAKFRNITVASNI